MVSRNNSWQQSRQRCLCRDGSGDQLGHANRGFQLRSNDVGGHWFAEEMTLPLVAAVRFDLLHLLIGLDALRDHDFVEARAETGNRSDDRLGIAFLVEALNERLIDLDLLEGKFSQIVERGVTGSEVVQRNANSKALELLDGRQRSIAVFEQQPLGDLKLQPLGGKPRLSQR